QPAGQTAFTATLKPCGISIPDFHTTPTFLDEAYGITFPAAEFDSKDVPTFDVTGQLSNLAPGATFTTGSTAVLLGLTSGTPATPFDKWPKLDDFTVAKGYTETDIDGDGNPGLTAVVKTGGSYKNIIYDLGPPPALSMPGRATKLYLSLRQIASET